MKAIYEDPKIEVINIESCDVICSSCCDLEGTGNSLPTDEL